MSTLNLSALKSGLSSLRKLGHDTDTFVSRGIEFKLRTITREELAIANELALPLFEIAREEESARSLGEWMKQVQLGVLSFAVLRVGDLDMEGVDFITDDTQPGPPIKVQKAIFLRELMAEWEDSMTSLLYTKFQELTEEAERKSRDGVKFLSKKPEDLLAEKEEEVSKLREELGLPQLVPQREAHTPPEQPTYVPPVEDEDVDVRALKEQILQPGPQHVEERDGYLYTLPPEPVKDYTQHDPTPAPQAAPEPPQQAPQEMSEQEQIALEHERLYQERQHRQQQRQPLNQTPVVVRSEDGHGHARRTANAPQQVQEAQFIPNPNGAELLSPSTRQQEGGASNFQANQKPRGKGNPNFYNPNRRQ